MFAMIALLLAQSPAEQHRLTWTTQADGTVTTYRRVGNVAVAARCRAALRVRCVVATQTVADHFAIRLFDGDALPIYTIGLLGDFAGYGCDWLGSTRTTMERIGNRNGEASATKFTKSGGRTWSRATVEANGGRYFPCVATLAVLRRDGLSEGFAQGLVFPVGF